MLTRKVLSLILALALFVGLASPITVKAEETAPVEVAEETVPEVQETLEPDMAVSEQYIQNQINSGKREFALQADVVLENDFTLPGNVFMRFNGYTITVPSGKTLTVNGQLGHWGDSGGLIVESGGSVVNLGYIGTAGILDIRGSYEGNMVYTTSYRSEAVINGIPNSKIWMIHVVDKGDPNADHGDLFLEYLNRINSTDYGYYSLLLHGSMVLPCDLVIPENVLFCLESQSFTLTIPAGRKITNYGEIRSYENQTVLNYGVVESAGYMNIQGPWLGNQPVKGRMTQAQLEAAMAGAEYYELKSEVVLERNMTIDKWFSIRPDAKLVVPRGVKLTIDRTNLVVVAGGTLEIQGEYELIQPEEGFNYILRCFENGVLANVTGVNNKDMALDCIVYNDTQLTQGLQRLNSTNYNWNFLEIYQDVTLTSNGVIPENCFMHLYNGATMTIPAGKTLVNNGEFYVWEGQTLQNNGVIENNKLLFIRGKLINAGQITVNSDFVVEDTGYVKNNGTVTAYNEILQLGTWTGNAPVVPHTHSYTEEVTPPTCTEQGYTTFTCECGDSYQGKFVPAEKHKFQEGFCTVCGEKDPEFVIPAADRIAGGNRISTALTTSEKLKEVLGVDKYNTIVVANAMNFPDALSGSYLAAAAKAPILLYKEGQTSVTNYIQENLAEGGTVYILGGESSVPESLVSALPGVKCERVSGSGRWATSLAIIAKADEIRGTKPEKVLICDGTGFADSLSASATGLPILLVNGKGDSLREDQKEYLESVRGAELYAIGGVNTIVPAMMDLLNAYDDNGVERVSGNGRELTSVAVAEKFFPGAKAAALASSLDFPDGLSGGPVAYAMNMPLLLTRKDKETIAANYVNTNGISDGYIIGGASAVSNSSAAAIFGIE